MLAHQQPTMVRRNILSLCTTNKCLPSRRFSSIVVEPEGVSIPALRSSFPFVWLRDACQCPQCVHPSTRQKLHRSSDFARGIKPVSVQSIHNGLRVSWAQPDSDSQHTSFYSASFLAWHVSPLYHAGIHRDVYPEPWKSITFLINQDISYTEFDKPETLLKVYRQLRREGLVFFTGVPTKETSGVNCELRKLATRLSEIRKTFYGETWDVRNVRNSKNIAYTNLDLGLHMDLLYLKEPPRYQILHALRNNVSGGQSIFVDALHVAQELRSASPDAFNELTETPVPFHYINDGHHLHHSHPTIELSPFQKDVITSISYSPPFQGPLPVNTPRSFYESLEKFAGLLDDPTVRVTRLLREGDAVLFDNRRILHGRTAFEDIPGEAGQGKEEYGQEGETNRWLKGCYLEEDPVLDRMRVLRGRLDE